MASARALVQAKADPNANELVRALTLPSPIGRGRLLRYRNDIEELFVFSAISLRRRTIASRSSSKM